MVLLLKQVKIIDPTSSFHNQTKDILVKNGKIEAIRNSISSETPVFRVEGAYVSPGWMDVGTDSGEPGHEQAETLDSLAEAALRGGFTSLVILPNTNPSLHSKPQIDFVYSRDRNLPVHLHALGALTRNCQGEEMAEILDMRHAGAIAFTDGKRSMQDTGQMLRSLDYVRSFQGLVINHPYQAGVGPEGYIHEGTVSVSLGLRGIPALAEVMMVKRDVDLLRYSQSRLHLLNISTAESVQLIREARKEGLDLTCSVPALNLEATVERIGDFNPLYKVMPPLRSEEDRLALWEGLKDGTIDFITCNHRPVDIEGKKLEFPYAEFGISSLETTFCTLVKSWGRQRNINLIAEKLAIRNRQILGLPVPTIERGNTAEITIYHSGLNTRFTAENFQSLSRNNPFLGLELPGRILGTISKGKYRSVV